MEKYEIRSIENGFIYLYDKKRIHIVKLIIMKEKITLVKN